MAAQSPTTQTRLPRSMKLPGNSPRGEKVIITWPQVFQRIHESAPRRCRLYGIPRGGAIVAGLITAHNADCSLVERPEDADWIIDDIVDSGQTKDAYALKHPKAFWALIDKRAEHITGWVEFPWEQNDTLMDADPHRSIVRLIEYLGEDPTREGLMQTPRRVLSYLKEMTEGYTQNIESILKTRFTEKYDELIVVRAMPFWSLCEHHLLPFSGTATVGYIPSGSIVGLSKIARLVHVYAKRLQVQERLTVQIADAINEHLKPRGVGVVIRASHMCMSMRGVRTPAAMVTSALHGVLRQEPAARAEFLKLADAV